MNGVPYRSWVEVSLSRIRSNFESIRALTGTGVEVMPVVKADAYRHGAIEVSRTLIEAGARWLAVSSVEEGVQLRQADIQTRILVMADFLPAERAALFDFHLTPVIHSLDDVSAFDLEARKRNCPADFHLKIDSGMGRLGTRAGAAEIAPVLKQCSHARIEGLMTHFASAADYASGQTEEQTQTFLAAKSGLESLGIAPKYVHMASGIPVAYGRRETWQKMVRPGHAIYGYVSPVSRGAAPARQVDVRPALVWKAALLAAKDIPEGAMVGYGGMFRAPHAMRIGILAAGYADGIPHRLSNKGKVIAGGKFASILGAVSMDLTTIDLTHAPHLKPGDAVTLLGTEGQLSIDAQQMARVAGTISYSVLCGISARVKRLYV